ncbi:hypothetical protein HQ590_08460 [bacterium]|nr:hypothetical protein [bacterium]
MKPARANRLGDRQRALFALKLAVVAGATSRYESLVDRAYAAGATDEDIDLTVHEAIEALFQGAEQPLTARDLAPRRAAPRLCTVA